ncbi:MAG: ATP-dependent zinc metalloprotease FtsH [Microgenomates group bacterium GW2011_GWC1_41_8]|uniref:ATP-dependent zinc metalloprotease FtsH n=3 Tax=Candidatus Roizmaniibacteriota TaxID=1752723 RepID=A0A0G0X9W3_9BACT|nr:MAG: ATP-dependent zinc metalloprotease FtsH [Candidatus Roizmanbacteria bacterium GW2011_GWB1_40_7]KKR94145.1 MAG: ATP-dependent zinc metalloprotease FtsH [Candidatus Roizmanbacteria bacterium GW2011_GWA1_41_13]KKS21720.1 MAG: ATP-dependent zinc metalloprotease FtsH [Candidatus Roizmanbacteria bacterium GW2011_GWC2_41_7]KKS23708.1 MAG: ATP-dependent zinc metalloprotease FtsH [Microgenomates group bacterium GW2011_GWC1_41_8]OGK50334.1 MAG: cell division protein FtsH [Candidatus Roizmanbacter
MKQSELSVPKPGKKHKKNGVHIFKFKFSVRDIIMWFLVVMLAFSLFNAFQSNMTTAEEVPVSQVIGDIKQGKVEKILVEDVKLKVTYKTGEEVVSIKEPGSSFNQLLVDAGIDLSSVQIENVDITFAMIMASLVGQLLPLLFIFGLLYFLYRQTRGAQDTLFNFGRSGAKMYSKKMPKITFKDVAGVDEAKEEMKEVVDFLKSPKRYLDLGARTPKGVLLVGPAGTGKTLLAKAVAGEAGVPFFSMAGSEFMEMLVGIGAKRVRDLFNTAKKNQPSIIFIDEVDAIGRRRSTGVMGSHDEREQTLNQILVEMDGFDPRANVIVIAATNRGDLLDPALLRPGRFDRRIVLDFPDIEGRKAILSIHAQGKPFTKEVDWHKVAKRTVGFSGADLENMLNEAAIMAARGDKKEIDMKDIEEAATKVKLGPEKKRLQSDQDRKMTAYHEAGHAVVTYALDHMDAVHRISIVSRGIALGYTLIPPDTDRLHETKSQLLEKIAMMMGGRAAEEIVFGDITSGAANDFDQATHIARLMVEEYGMSVIGPVNFGPDMDITDYNNRFFERDGVSPAMQELIDKEIQKILVEGHKKAFEVLKQNRQKLDKVAEALVEKETIEGDEFEKIMKEGK